MKGMFTNFLLLLHSFKRRAKLLFLSSDQFSRQPSFSLLVLPSPQGERVSFDLLLFQKAVGKLFFSSPLLKRPP